jgi:hypothetical protein
MHTNFESENINGGDNLGDDNIKRDTKEICHEGAD